MLRLRSNGGIGTDGFNSVVIIDNSRQTTVFVVANKSQTQIPVIGQRLARALRALAL